MDPARILYERFLSLGGTEIDKLVGTTIEDLYLDCKLATSVGGLSKDDLKNAAKTTSAFANAAGGVILWGVNHARDSDGVDRVIGAPGVKNCAEFMAELNGAIGQLVGPPVEGWECEICGTDDGRTFLVCYVPRGRTLHMARAQNQHCYYLRSGSGTHKMESHEIAARYGRSPEPLLSLHGRVEQAMSRSGPSGSFQHYKVILSLRNSGLGLGKHPALHIVVEGDLDDLSITCAAGFMERPNASHVRDRREALLVGAEVVLCPEMVHDVGIVNLAVNGTAVPPSFIIKWHLYHEGQPLSGSLVVGPLDFRASQDGAHQLAEG